MARKASVIHPSRIDITSRYRFEHSSARRCKLVFGDTVEVQVPTSFIVLPYKLRWDKRENKLMVPSSGHIQLASHIGRCLLQINKATAKLSFWLQVKRSMDSNSQFKLRLKEWLRRARVEPSRDISREIVEHLSIEKEYVDVCQEMLQKDDNISNALAYVKNPSLAAYNEMRDVTNRMLKYYHNKPNFFYLIDEYRGVPVSCANNEDMLYPLQIGYSEEMFRNVFLPLMNMSAMSAVSLHGLSGLQQLLGLKEPTDCRLKWKVARKGLVHRFDDKFSVAAFASLRRQLSESFEVHAHSTKATNDQKKLKRETPSTSALPRLQRFFLKHDPQGLFSNLKQMSAIGIGPAIWVAEEVIENLKESGKQAYPMQRFQKAVALTKTMNHILPPVKLNQFKDSCDLSKATESTERSGTSKCIGTGKVSGTFTTDPNEKARKNIRSLKSLLCDTTNASAQKTSIENRKSFKSLAEMISEVNATSTSATGGETSATPSKDLHKNVRNSFRALLGTGSNTRVADGSPDQRKSFRKSVKSVSRLVYDDSGGSAHVTCTEATEKTTEANTSFRKSIRSLSLLMLCD